MITLLLLGLVGMGAVGATYAIGPLQKHVPQDAQPAVPWALTAAGLAAAVFSPIGWLALLGIGVAIAGAHQLTFGTVWAVPERPAPAAIPGNAKAQPRPSHLRVVPDTGAATLPRPPGTPRPSVAPEVPGAPTAARVIRGDQAGSFLDFAKDAATEYLTSGAGGVPDRFSSAWRTALAQWPSTHPTPEVVKTQMDSNPDGPILNVDLRLPERVKWDGHVVERWVDQSNRAVSRGGKLVVFPIRPLGEDVYRFTVATAA